jgi:hypothetical protein
VSATSSEGAAPLAHYLALLRPKGFGAAALFVGSGYVLAPRRGLPLLADLALLFVSYVLCISGGTLLYNSACDRDEGPVNFLDAPPPPPPHLHAVGLGTMALGALLLASRGVLAFALGAAMVVLSVAYSGGLFGARRLKETPPFDWLVNAAGYGAMSVLLGYSVTGAPLTAEVGWVALAFSFSISASFPASQLFQLEPGERNTAAWLGPARALDAGAALLVLAWVCLLAARRSSPVGFVAFSVPFLAAAVTLVRWSRAPLAQPKARLGRLLQLLLGARLLWMASVLW